MGFGWLLVGYFFANVMSLYSPLSFAMLAGYPMMIMGLWRLTPYHTRFRYAFYGSFVSLPFAIYFSIYAFSQLGFQEIAILNGSFFAVMEWCYFGFSLLFHAMLLYAIAGLTAELGLVALQGNAWRNLIFVGLYYLVDGFARLPISWVNTFRAYFSLILILLRLSFLLLNMYLIYKCYRYICPEGEDPSNKRQNKSSNKKGDKT